MICCGILLSVPSFHLRITNSVTRTVQEPKQFSGELSRTFGSGSVQNVDLTSAHRILKEGSGCADLLKAFDVLIWCLGSNFVSILKFVIIPFKVYDNSL